MTSALSMAYGWDRAIASSLFFDRGTGQFIGDGAWWARDLLHHGGRNLIRTAGALALLIWLGSYRIRAWSPWRRPAAYVALCLFACAAIVAALKVATQTDCPRDLIEFGGLNPYLGLLERRAASLPPALCFPGAHAASGFALIALFYAAAHRWQRYDWRWLIPGLLTGTVFAFAQEARGAHFLSHDLAGAAISLTVAVTFAAWMLTLPDETSPSITPAAAQPPT